MRIHLYGEKLFSYELKMKLGGAPSPKAPLFPVPTYVCFNLEKGMNVSIGLLHNN